MFLLLAVLVTAASAAEETRPPAYTAEMVITGDGHTTRMHVWSDGTIYKVRARMEPQAGTQTTAES